VRKAESKKSKLNKQTIYTEPKSTNESGSIAALEPVRGDLLIYVYAFNQLHQLDSRSIFTVWCYDSAAYAMKLHHKLGVLTKWLNVSKCKQCRITWQWPQFSDDKVHGKIPMGSL